MDAAYCIKLNLKKPSEQSLLFKRLVSGYLAPWGMTKEPEGVGCALEIAQKLRRESVISSPDFFTFLVVANKEVSRQGLAVLGNE